MVYRGNNGDDDDGDLRERERERESSELYYTRIKILGSCLFLQSVPASLHANREGGREREIKEL